MNNPYKLLKKTGLQVSYMRNKKEIELPYLIYLGNGSINFKADNKIYNTDNTYIVEYYFKNKNENLERQIEALFNENNIIWEKTEDIFIPDENMIFIRYFLK